MSDAMLNLDPNRAPAPIKLAATVVSLRETQHGFDVLCVKRHPKSGFLGNVVVFPGGKVDLIDHLPEWKTLATSFSLPSDPNDETHDFLRPFAVAAFRELLEEAKLSSFVGGSIDAVRQRELSRSVSGDANALLAFCKEAQTQIDVSNFTAFARWVTPEAEARRFDTRFFIARAPDGIDAESDGHETVSIFFEPAKTILDRFERDEIQLAPPTHHTLTLLAECRTIDDAIALASRSSLKPICPILVRHHDAQGETSALALPGDPEHPLPASDRVDATRYVLRGSRWLPESAPPPPLARRD